MKSGFTAKVFSYRLWVCHFGRCSINDLGLLVSLRISDSIFSKALEISFAENSFIKQGLWLLVTVLHHSFSFFKLINPYLGDDIMGGLEWTRCCSSFPAVLNFESLWNYRCHWDLNVEITVALWYPSKTIVQGFLHQSIFETMRINHTERIDSCVKTIIQEFVLFWEA
jgi:hypothetical protein